jgi:chromosome segregation ATPase
LTRESGRAVESARSEVTQDLKARNAHIAELERQLEHETAERRNLSETRRALQEHLDTSGQHILELEGELAAARERLVLIEDEKNSLQNSIEQALTETARLNPASDRQRQHGHRDPRATRQARGDLRRDL